MAPTMSDHAIFTGAFRSKFGTRAIDVARGQVAAAPAGEQRAAWQAILDDLTAASGTPGNYDTSVGGTDVLRNNAP